MFGWKERIQIRVRKRMTKEEWHYAKKREELIKMTEEFIKIGNPRNAMDVVDAIIVSVWDNF